MSPETETPAAAASAPMLKETVQESPGFIFTFNKEFWAPRMSAEISSASETSHFA